MGRNVELPRVEAGDILIVHDTGAYTMVMYSRYNSILPSPVYGFWRNGDDFKFALLKKRETPDEANAFWGLQKPEALP